MHPCHRKAHPRSRGENVDSFCVRVDFLGSSPLTRGKHDDGIADHVGIGLIPAHAGKTREAGTSRMPSRAHPRSRGENDLMPAHMPSMKGSSPLTRGKHADDGAPADSHGLIPAHAGKTRPPRATPVDDGAHPRSRGENSCRWRRPARQEGSSPLTRGKPYRSAPLPAGCGLIPAHAGKTLPDLRFYCADRSDLGKP